MRHMLKARFDAILRQVRMYEDPKDQKHEWKDLSVDKRALYQLAQDYQVLLRVARHLRDALADLLLKSESATVRAFAKSILAHPDVRVYLGEK